MVREFRCSNRRGSFFADCLILATSAGMGELCCTSFMVLHTLSVFQLYGFAYIISVFGEEVALLTTRIGDRWTMIGT